VINAVSNINKIEIPSIPNLNFMKPLIQKNSSKNWKSEVDLSNEYQRNNVRKKFTKVVNIETYIAPLLVSFFSSFVRSIKNAPINGRNVIEESIGKFIYI
tara:strand:+ start:1577 stop:1876 length:300 start_codon:yes stop_codon:yes gene_type:complete